MDLVISRGYFFFFSFFSLHGSLALTLRDCENDWKNICLFIGDASMLFNRRFVNLFRLITLPPVWILMALPLLYFQFEAVGKLISLPISHRSCFIIFLLLFFPFFFFFFCFFFPLRSKEAISKQFINTKYILSSFFLSFVPFFCINLSRLSNANVEYLITSK